MQKKLTRKYRNKWNRMFVVLCMAAAVLWAGIPKQIDAAQNEKKTVRIGYLGYEGFITQPIDGDYSGYGVEFLDEIASYTNWKYEYVYGTLESQLENLRTGRVDFIMQMQKTPEREAEFLYSKNIIPNTDYIILLPQFQYFS